MHKIEVLRRIGLSAALLALLAAPGRAQTPQPQLLPEVTDDLHMNEPLQARFDRRGQLEPIEIGPFQVSLLTQFDFAFNDNIYAQTNNQKSDFFFDIGAKAITTYRYEDFSAELDTYVLDHQFLRYTTEDYWETNNALLLREAPAPDFSYFLNTGLARLAVPRTDPNPLDGKNPATYLLYTGLGGVTLGSGQRNLLTLSVGFDKTQFDQIQPIVLDAAQRNRTEVYGDFRLDHVFFGQQKIFVELRHNTRSYDQPINTAGFRQASNGGRIDTGVQLEPDGAFLITVSSGWQQQKYDDARFGSIGEPDATVEVQWSPTLLTQLDAKYIHEYAEDIETFGGGSFGLFDLGNINSPGYTHDQAIVTVQHELRRDFLATFYVSDDYRELERSPRRYQVLDIGPRLQYRLPSQVTLGFTYDREELHSNGPVNYGDDIAMITVKKQF